MAKKLFFYLILFIGSSLVLFAACTPQELEPVPVGRRPTPSPTLVPSPVPTLVKMDRAIVEPRPDFISALRPPEYYIVPLSLYNYHAEGVVVTTVPEYEPMNPRTYAYGFQTSICIEPKMELLIQEGDKLTDFEGDERPEERMELFVDGKLVEPGPGGSLSGLLYVPPTREPESPRTEAIVAAGYCWKVPLSVGKHEVTYRFHQTSGDIKAYTWYFEISA